MTLRDLERMVYRYTNKNVSVPNAETQQRVRGFINQRHRDILTEFSQLRDDILTFESAEDQQDYSIPEQGITRINRIWEDTNRTSLEQRSLAWLRANDPDPQIGTPQFWIPMSYTQVHTQPSAPDSVWVDSTSASDTGQCYVEGITANGFRQSVEVTMDGITAVDVAPDVPDWIEIDKFYLSQAAVGTVTLHEGTGGGTQLSDIAPGDTYAKYYTFLLYPTPSTELTYLMDVTRSIHDMVNPLDEPLLPADFHSMLAVGARLDEYEFSDDMGRRRLAEIEWDRWYKKLTTWLVAHPSVRLDLNAEPGRGERSSLGAWFPAGS